MSEGATALQDIDEAGDVIEARALVVTDAAAAPALFGTTDPMEIVAKARDVANSLKDVLKTQGLIAKIPTRSKDANGNWITTDREFVVCEGWTLLGSMLGVFPVNVWTRKLDNGWEARVEARNLGGNVVGAAEAECTREEKSWSSRDDYALRSMAQTRATAKALRMPLGFVMTLAGYSATPAEEMPRDEGPRDLAAEGEAIVAARQKGPKCPKHGPLNFKPAGVSAATKKPYSAYWICIRSCTEGEPRNGVAKPYNMFDDQWRLQQQMNQPKEGPDADPDDLPNER